MNEQPKLTQDPKALLRRAAREVPLAVLSYGLGYGIARTALEQMKTQNVSGLRKTLPLLAGGAALYAGHRLDKHLMRPVEETDGRGNPKRT